MSAPRTLLMSLCLALLSITAHAEPQDMGVTVLELFTTQGCANCPPADEVLKNIAAEHDDQLIILGCHVTYFDRGDFKDTLSEFFCDARHKAYFIGLPLDKLYTPQIIINGTFDTIGNKEDMVRSGVKMGQSMKSVIPIQLDLRESTLDISLPKMRLDQPVDVWLFSYEKMNSVNIAAGQNVGAAIDYANAVRHIEKLLRWDGSYQNMSFPLGEIPGEGYAVIAQFTDHTEIVAAGKIEREIN